MSGNEFKLTDEESRKLNPDFDKFLNTLDRIRNQLAVQQEMWLRRQLFKLLPPAVYLWVTDKERHEDLKAFMVKEGIRIEIGAMGETTIYRGLKCIDTFRFKLNAKPA